MRSEKIARRLRESLDDGRFVGVTRSSFDAGPVDGVVVAVTDEWVVVHELCDGVHLDSVVMLRLEDVTRVSFRDDDDYHHRAVDALGVPVASFDVPADVTTADLLASAGAGGTVLGFRLETHTDESYEAGRLAELRKKSFDVHFVGRDGTWSERPDRWRYKDVTRIEVGGRYLDALNRFADPGPDEQVDA